MDVKATLFSLIYFFYSYIQVSAEYWKSIGKFVFYSLVLVHEVYFFFFLNK